LHALADEQSVAWYAVLPRGRNFGRNTYWTLWVNFMWDRIFSPVAEGFGWSGRKFSKLFGNTAARAHCSPPQWHENFKF
jgi:hypothetical protein